MAEPELSEVLIGALRSVFDPCCRELGLSIVDMGVVRSARLKDGVADVELTLTSGWCPSMTVIVTETKTAISSLPEVERANVEITWKEAWSPDRMSDGARAKLRLLPTPKEAMSSDLPVLLAELRQGVPR